VNIDDVDGSLDLRRYPFGLLYHGSGSLEARLCICIYVCIYIYDKN